ncbi:S46 family peptidase [Gaoshiqia sp. Z1-71]|uniref:S46 family peptidase n=1 Tax=Gaoshiqia hydrogeniformans TaxID=3290090 RepID=UPI003BF85D1D
MQKVLFSLAFTILIFRLSAKEGMWIPTLMEKYNIEDMRQMGFRLNADDIYSINRNSMKDAVVLFGSGCTGELVSEEGLLLTNHHCGYSAIQSHSSVEHDYLTDGFWAMSKEEELPNPGLIVRFLERMDDVTDSILSGTEGLEGDQLAAKIKRNTRSAESVFSEKGKFEAVVKPIFHGNQYFVYIYKVYRDVRLVGAPPSSIGKFGGDTDNWMWPRHTGDFSIFRIYADRNNEPAEYSPDNVPYRPKSFFPISKKGIRQDDFILVFGFPGSTEQYLPSQEVDLIMHQSDPDKVKIRTEKLEIMARHMDANPKVRIQYASKYARTSNSWKRWQGEIKGLKRMNAPDLKRSFEQQFKNWYEQNDSLISIYSAIFPRFEKLYIDLTPYNKAYNYYDEIVIRGTDIFSLADNFPRNGSGWSQINEDLLRKYKEELNNRIREYFKDYDQKVDEEVFVRLIRVLYSDLDPSFLPNGFRELMRLHDDAKLLDKVYRKSVFTDEKKLLDLVEQLDEKTIEKLQKDPVMALYKELRSHYARNIESVYQSIRSQIDVSQQIYMRGIMEMQKERALYPDANLTLRVAYGKVEGYKPADGVVYKYYTTLKGIVEKDNPLIYDYDVPQRLRDLYAAKDYGDYAREGELPVAFAASVHTTGGNSGSPAINANGELVGINFDRCWEGTMSDIMYDPDVCRNIMIDIRYVLFLIDKFAGAGYLLDEMDLRHN